MGGIVRRSVRRSVCRRARVLGKVACGWELKSEEHHFLELERGLEGAELPLTWCHIDVGTCWKVGFSCTSGSSEESPEGTSIRLQSRRLFPSLFLRQ